MAGGTPGMKPSTSAKPSFTPQESRGVFTGEEQFTQADAFDSEAFLDNAATSYLLDQRFQSEAQSTPTFAPETLDPYQQLDVLSQAPQTGLESLGLSGLSQPDSTQTFSQFPDNGPVEIFNSQSQSTSHAAALENNGYGFAPDIWPETAGNFAQEPLNEPEQATSTNTLAEAMQAMNNGTSIATEPVVSAERQAVLSYEQRAQTRIVELQQIIQGYSGRTYKHVSGRETLVAPSTLQQPAGQNLSLRTLLNSVFVSLRQEDKARNAYEAYRQRAQKRQIRKGPGMFEGAKEQRMDTTAVSKVEAPHEFQHDE